MGKFLDYSGLTHFYEKIDEQKQDRLTIDTVLDSTSKNPVENQAIKFEIDQLAGKISDGDAENTYFYELYNLIIPVTGNTYTSTCYCLKNGLVVTIYLDLKGSIGASSFSIPNLIPEDCRPFKTINYLIAQSQSQFNNVLVETDGQIIVTSNSGVLDTHCAITYLVKPSSIIPDPLPSEDAKYNTTATLLKIGNYFPTYTNGKMGNQTVLGAALVTDVSGSQFSGYDGGYTVYMSNGSYKTFNTNETTFYWNKKFTNEIENNKGFLFDFTDCYEANNGDIDESDLISHGLAAVAARAVDEEQIQYFVTSFGKSPWIGGVNSPFNAQIKDKAYGNTLNADDYNGRFYWTDAILAHVFRYVPASADPEDKSHPITKDGDVIGYVDKIIPLKLIDTAYGWANFKVSNNSTWRGIKLISTQEELTDINALFTARLVIEDWNDNRTTGNKFGNISSYYQKIDVELNEEVINDNSTIEQTVTYYRPASTWAKTSSKLSTYSGPEFD